MNAMFENTRNMKRRAFLNGTLAGVAPAKLPACRFSDDQGISIPDLCLRPNQVDHQLPGIMPLFSPGQFVMQGLLEAGQAWMLRRSTKHGALLFRIAPKRSLSAGNSGVPSGFFETRWFFRN